MKRIVSWLMLSIMLLSNTGVFAAANDSDSYNEKLYSDVCKLINSLNAGVSLEENSIDTDITRMELVKNSVKILNKGVSLDYNQGVLSVTDVNDEDAIDEIRPITLDDKAQKLYKAFVKESYMELSKGEQGAPVAVTATNILTRLLRLQQITGGFIRPDEESERYEQISSAKLNALEDIIDTAISENKKLVVIARFIPEIKEICKMLDKKKIKYAHICGEVKDRAAEVDAFQNNPECMVFVGQLQTVSMGLTLTAASTMVFYSLSYNFADYSQAKARIHRIGQKNNCLYIHLVVKNTVDETVLKALEQKENIATKIVDDWRSILK